MKENSLEEIEVFVGSGNVFADLELSNPEERQLKAHLSIEIEEAIKSQRLSRPQAALKIGVSQEELEKIIQGQLAGFSVGQLINCLNDLDRDVELSVSVRKRQPEKSSQNNRDGVRCRCTSQMNRTKPCADTRRGIIRMSAAGF